LKITTELAKIDMGQNVAFKVPATTWSTLETIFTNMGWTCTGTNCGSTDICSKLTPLMKDITINIDNMLYVIPPTGYTLSEQSYDSTWNCAVSIINGASTDLTVGMHFFASFYASFDYTTPSVDLGISSAAGTSGWTP
jgi:hypothetical protein